MRMRIAAVLIAAGVLSAHTAHADSYYLSSQTIGCPDVQGALAIRRVMPFISNGLTLVQRVTIEQNGCEVMPANLGGTVIGRPSGYLVQFKPDGSDWAPMWVRRGLLVRAKWADGQIQDTKCYEQDGAGILHDAPC